MPNRAKDIIWLRIIIADSTDFYTNWHVLYFGPKV